jgi:hypothetical protein
MVCRKCFDEHKVSAAPMDAAAIDAMLARVAEMEKKLATLAHDDAEASASAEAVVPELPDYEESPTTAADNLVAPDDFPYTMEPVYDAGQETHGYSGLKMLAEEDEVGDSGVAAMTIHVGSEPPPLPRMSDAPPPLPSD